jgi:phosphatidate cytidylyltransferase
MKRVFTALLLVPIALYAILFAPWWIFVAVVAVFACLCFYEYANITESFAPLGFVAGMVVLLSHLQDIPIVLMLTALAGLCLPLAAPDIAKAVPRAGMLILGVLYVFGSWKTGILLHDVNQWWLMFGLMVNWVGDTGAYYAGRRWGRHKLAPIVSPGKSWEGAIASGVVSIGFGMLFLPRMIPGVSLLAAAVVALLANAAGQLGDLAESAIKRGAGVKDSGTILPGHGGMLDRLDSTLFTLPVLWALVGVLRVAG